MSDNRIKDLDHYLSLWEEIYSSPEGPKWDHLLPYYHEDITFRDSVQEIKGIDDFRDMTKRLTKRSKNLEVRIHNAVMTGDRIFIEWEMIISYKRYPKTSIYGVSRTTLSDGKIVDQRDYFDLWGDIIRNIRFLSRGYRRFMKKRFG